MRPFLIAWVAALTAGCWGGQGLPDEPRQPLLRKTNVWVGETVDEDGAATLKRAGVHRLVVRRGSIDLTSGTPVINSTPPPDIAGDIPVSVAFRLETGLWHVICNSADTRKHHQNNKKR